MYVHVAVHEPVPARYDEARRLLVDIGTAIAGAEGLLNCYVGEDTGRRRLSAVTMWRDEACLERCLPAIIEAVGKTPLREWAAAAPQVIRLHGEVDS